MEHAVLESGMDRYVISEHLAEGGMGAIYLGKKVGVGGSAKDVVLKQLLPEFTTHPEFIGLFLREAKLSAALDHVNIVRTLDLVTSGNDYFIVMEYVRGGDLRAVLRKVKRQHLRLSAQAGLYIVREILSALDYAHNRRSSDGQPLKLIHRDISPSNVMLSLAGEVKLTDFGIAKVSTHKSVFYRVKGKAGYMSPEQAFGDRPIDHRSDLYSLAVCLYEVLAGERLFVADLISSAKQIYSQQLPKLESFPGMPKGVDLLLARALAHDPDERFQTAPEFQEAILHVAYNNNLICSATDLARELRQKCGPSPQAWRSDEEVEPQPERPTEIFASSTGSLSGIELTSILGAVLHRPYESDPAAGMTSPLDAAALRQSISTVRIQATKRAQVPPTPDIGPIPPGTDGRDWRARSPSSGLQVQDEDETIPYFPPPEDALDSSPAAARGRHSDEGTSLADAFGQITNADTIQRPAAFRGARPTRDAIHQQETLLLDAESALRRAAPSADRSGDAFEVRPEHERLAKQRERRLLLGAGGLLVASGLMLGALGMLGSPPDGGAPRRASPSGAQRGPAAPSSASGLKRGQEAVPAERQLTAQEVLVVSTPSQADVHLDGSFRCRSPCRVPVSDTSRAHVLSVRKNGFVSWSTLVVGSRGAAEPIRAALQREPAPDQVGYLVVHSPRIADVLVDAKPIGRVTSAGRIPLVPGRYEITLRGAGSDSRSTFHVIVRKGQTVTKEVSF